MKPRLLVVPHVYAENVAVREIELARRLVEFFDVYCLKWNDAVHVAGSSPGNRRWKQVRAAVGAAIYLFRKRVRVKKKGEIALPCENCAQADTHAAGGAPRAVKRWILGENRKS